MKSKNKHRIQHNVDHRADHRRHHSKPWKSLRRDKVIHSHGQQCKKSSQRIDGQIGVRIRKCHLTGTKPAQQLILGQQKHNRQHCRQDQQHRKTVCLDTLRALFVPCSQTHGKKHRSADSHQRSERRKQRDDRCAHSRPRQRIRSDHRDISHINPVYDTV